MKHLRLIGIMILSLMTFASAWADDIPYRQQRREIFRQLPVHENNIVFLGNSITDFGLWSEFFGSDANIINRGIQGIESPEVLEHLSLIGSGHPKKLFLMIGINDFKTPERVVPNIRKMIEVMKRESPQTTLYVQSILPCNIAERASEPGTLNPQIKALCEEMNVTYIDVYGAMTKISGNTSMPANMTDDSLHPNVFGYREWCKLVAPYVDKASAIAETGTVNKPLGRGIYNSILSEYQLVPVNDGDILHVGDYQVMTGEWGELMGMPTFKNRGLGGGYGWSMSLDEFNSAYTCLIKGNPSKIFFQCGKRALDDKPTDISGIVAKYKTAVNNIKAIAPNAEIYLESIIPNADASINTTSIVPFNAEIKAIADESTSDKVFFVDVYAALVENGKLATRYQGANTVQSRGINGRGYVAWANVLKSQGGLTAANVPANMTDAQSALSEATWDALDKVWANSGTKSYAALRQAISDSRALLAAGNASDEACTAQLANLTAAQTTGDNASPTSADALPGSDHLMPAPQILQKNTGSAFALDRPVKIENDFTDTELLNEILAELGCNADNSATAIVKVNQVSAIAGADEPTLAGFESEAYTLSIDGNTITIDAISRVGVIRAAQTIQQLAEADGGHAAALEGLTITDWPAFKVRGFMHDVGRSFITVDELEKQIKLYSRFKVNVFQWHMTENQAWRFEVTKHPELTQASSMTRFAGSYYSQADCRKIDALAHKYGIYVIPEIDMPGHSQAFTRATGVNMQSDAGIAILKDALDDCINTFTYAPYIHIGGDEVSITYPDFLNIMTDYVHDNSNKRVMWWNTCAGTGTTHKLINPATDHCDMGQCWASSGTQIKGFPCIDCRYNYTNHFDVFADLVGMYRSNIFGKQHGDAETAGFISCPWNDRKTPTQNDIIEQNNVYAVTIATGERAWRGGGKQYIEKCGAVLPNDGDEYEEFKNWEQRFLFHKAHSLQNEPIPYVKQTNVRWRISDPISNGGDASRTFSQWEDCKAQGTDMPTSVTVSGQKYGWNLATGAGIYLNHTWPTAVPGIFGLNQAKNRTAYAYTYIYNKDAERTVGAQIEFQNYGRSENDAAPAAGQWDRKGSKIWWNGTEIAAPNWKNAGKGINSEVDLQDENFPAREPVQLTLKQGWNKVFIKLPYVDASNVRLNKWLYTFVLTDLEGKNAIEGLVYSPTKTLEGPEPDPAEEIDYSPLISDDHSSYYYSLKTPGRDNRYASSQGANAEMTGVTSPTNASYWKFVQRTDGDLDIVNYADGSFVSPTADNNTALSTQQSSPEKGWKLKPAATKGYFIIVSGETEWNQTKSTQSYKVYNWGYGSKTTGEYNYDDGGCQYEILINEELTVEDYTYVGVEPGKTYTITNIQKNSSQFPLYVDGSNNLCIGNSGQDYGTSSQFLVEGHKGKVAFKNVATGQYLVWKGKNGGTNGNKGTLGTYNADYCDWTLTASTHSQGNYWIWANRDNGTPGALMIKNDKTWDAYSNTEGWLDQYSNVYKFTEVSTEEFPKPSTDEASYWYTLKGDRDSGRYVTATNVSAGMMSATALDGEEHADYWKFEKRNDGTYDIINRKYNCYVTPDATNNTQLTTSNSRPASGWTITPSTVEGKYLITNTNASGAVQMHVCNGGNNYKIFNWGGGSNTTGGCNFTIEYVEETLASFPLSSDETTQHWYTFKDKRGSKYTRAQGVSTGMVGNTALDNTDHSDCWKFVKRDDGTYDIINFKYNCYIATGAANNSQLQTSQTRPQTGWIVTETAEPGFYIITNEGGSKVQLHQATSANVLNWGYGSTGFAGAFNNTDPGCLFGISEVEGLVPSEDNIHALQTKINAAWALIASETIGYPTLSSPSALAIATYTDGGVTADNKTAAAAALNALYAETNVNLPLAGHAYRIAFNCSGSDKKYYIAPNGNPVEGTAGAATFIVGKKEEASRPFFFIVKDGSHYLNYKGATTEPSSYKAVYNDFSLQALSASSSSGIGQGEAYTSEKRFGYLYMASAGRPEKESAVGGMVMNESNHSWDGTSDPFFNGSYTSALTFEEVPYAYNMTKLAKDGKGQFYSTIYLPFPMQIPEDIQCYKATADRGDNLALSLMNKENNAIVPAGGYVLYSEMDCTDNWINALIPPAGTNVVADNTNIFTGSTSDEDGHQMYLDFLKDRNPYVLSMKNETVGFYRYAPKTEETEIYPKGKAIYISATDGNINGFALSFDNIVEAISTLRSEGTDSILFDLSGRRVINGAKGIVISSNRKAVVK